MINHGIIEGKRPEDYMAGAFTFVSYEVRNESGDWRPYLPKGEVQYAKEDSFSCVSFSACNSIETQIKFLTGQEVNFSDRFLAKMSGTTHDGNYLYKVGDIVRNVGLVVEDEYPAPPDYTFDQYHADIPEPLLSVLKEKGQAFLRKWDVKTEFVPATKEDMLKHLKHAPLQITVPGHAILGFFCEQDVMDYFDSYRDGGDFTNTARYPIIKSAYKYVLTPKTMAKKFIINDGGKIGVAVIEGFTGTIVFAKTPQALQEIKDALEVPADAPTYNYPQ